MLACDGVRHGWMGRQLLNLFSEAGLSDIVVNGNVLSSDYACFKMVFGCLLQDAQTAGKVSGEELIHLCLLKKTGCGADHKRQAARRSCQPSRWETERP